MTKAKLAIALIAAFVCTALTPRTLEAVPILIEGNTLGSPNAVATGTLDIVGNTLTLTLDNTSAFDARITGIGFDLVPGDVEGADGLDGFTALDVGDFIFSDGALGNVPQFASVVLDFGFITGPNFAGGSPNDGQAPGDADVVFTVTGNFLGMSAEQLATALFVRFQRVGPTGADSDVGRGSNDDQGDVPEPASALLLAGAMAAGLGRLRTRPERRTKN